MKKPQIMCGILALAFFSFSAYTHHYYKNYEASFQDLIIYERDYDLATETFPELLDLNTVTAAQLDKLPGINKAQAEQIIALRDQLGEFTSFAQLQGLSSLPDSLVLSMQNYLYIPAPLPTDALTEPPAAPTPAVTEPLLLDLNTADQEALMRLPGIGEVTAAAIIRYRAQVGAFSNRRQLLEIPGIGDATLSGIIDYLYIENELPLTESPSETEIITETEPPFTDPPEIPIINLNTATKEELMLLPECDEALALEVLALRDGIHVFSHIWEIMYVESMTPELFGKWKYYITVGEAESTESTTELN